MCPMSASHHAPINANRCQFFPNAPNQHPFVVRVLQFELEVICVRPDAQRARVGSSHTYRQSNLCRGIPHDHNVVNTCKKGDRLLPQEVEPKHAADLNVIVAPRVGIVFRDHRSRPRRSLSSAAASAASTHARTASSGPASGPPPHPARNAHIRLNIRIRIVETRQNKTCSGLPAPQFGFRLTAFARVRW